MDRQNLIELLHILPVPLNGMSSNKLPEGSVNHTHTHTHHCLLLLFFQHHVKV